MSDDVTSEEKNFAQKYGDWLWKLGLLIMVSAQLYVQSHYVSKDDFSTALKALSEVHDKVLVIEQKLTSADNTEQRIETARDAINDIRQKLAAMDIRLTACEQKHGSK